MLIVLIAMAQSIDPRRVDKRAADHLRLEFRTHLTPPLMVSP